MKVKCINTDIPFYKEGIEYIISREFVCNAGVNKGICFTEIRLNNDMVKRVKTDDLDSGKCDFVRISE